MAVAEEQLEQLARDAWGAGVRGVDPHAHTITIDMDAARAFLRQAGRWTPRLPDGLNHFLRKNVDLGPDEAYRTPSGLFDLHTEGGDVVELDYIPAPDLERIGDRLIGECEEFSHLVDTRVLFLWRREGGKHHDQLVLGKCTKVSGMVGHFTDAPWVIWLAADNCWGLTRQQIEAALYHELLHAGEDVDDKGEKKPKIQAHDTEVFALEIKRYGAWKNDLELNRKAWEAHQLSYMEQLGDKAIAAMDRMFHAEEAADDQAAARGDEEVQA